MIYLMKNNSQKFAVTSSVPAHAVHSDVATMAANLYGNEPLLSYTAISDHIIEQLDRAQYSDPQLVAEIKKTLDGIL